MHYNRESVITLNRVSVFYLSVEFEDEDPDLVAVTVKVQSPDRSLRVIKEDEEGLIDVEEEEDEEDKKVEIPVHHVGETQDEGNKEQGLTEEELAVLSKLDLYHLSTFCYQGIIGSLLYFWNVDFICT